jgi:hypothetical protein
MGNSVFRGKGGEAFKYRILKYCLEYLQTGSHSTCKPVFWILVTRSWSKFATNFRVPIIKSRGDPRPITYAIAFRDANTTFILKNKVSLSVRAVSNSPFIRKFALHLVLIKKINHE